MIIELLSFYVKLNKKVRWSINPYVIANTNKCQLPHVKPENRGTNKNALKLVETGIHLIPFT